MFAASSLGGAAREQFAAIEAGGVAVEAPPTKGQLKDRPAAGRRCRKSVEMTATKRISDVLFPRGFEVAYMQPLTLIQNTKKTQTQNSLGARRLLRTWARFDGLCGVHVASEI